MLTPTRLFLVERYLRVETASHATEIAARLEEAEGQLSRRGRDVRWLHSLVLPQDEQWLCLFSAADAADVLELNRIAGLTFESVLQAQVIRRSRRSPG